MHTHTCWCRKAISLWLYIFNGWWRCQIRSFRDPFWREVELGLDWVQCPEVLASCRLLSSIKETNSLWKATPSSWGTVLPIWSRGSIGLRFCFEPWCFTSQWSLRVLLRTRFSLRWRAFNRYLCKRMACRSGRIPLRREWASAGLGLIAVLVVCTIVPPLPSSMRGCCSQFLVRAPNYGYICLCLTNPGEFSGILGVGYTVLNLCCYKRLARFSPYLTTKSSIRLNICQLTGTKTIEHILLSSLLSKCNIHLYTSLLVLHSAFVLRWKLVRLKRWSSHTSCLS